MGTTPAGEKWELLASTNGGGLNVTLVSGGGSGTAGGFDAGRDLNLGQSFDPGKGGNSVQGTVTPKVGKVDVALSNGMHKTAPLFDAPSELDVPTGTRFYVLFTGKETMKEIAALDRSGKKVMSYSGRAYGRFQPK